MVNDSILILPYFACWYFCLYNFKRYFGNQTKS